MIITTTEHMEGMKIRKYLGIVSGTEIYLVGGLIGGGLVNQEGLYTNALKMAMSRMEEKARQLGADAIVGVCTNFTSPGGLNSMIVAVTGTAVQTDIREQEEKARKQAQEQAEKNRAEQEAAIARERQRRREAYRQLEEAPDKLNQMGRFLHNAEDLTRVSEVLEMWESVMPDGGDLTRTMEKKIRDTARVEKLYGPSAGNVKKLVAELWQIMSDAEK